MAKDYGPMDQDTVVRIAALENGQITLQSSMLKMEQSVDRLASNFNAYINEQAKAPKAVPFKEIMWTIVCCFGFVVSVITFIDARADSRISPYHQASQDQKLRIDRLEKQNEKIYDAIAPLIYSRKGDLK